MNKNQVLLFIDLCEEANTSSEGMYNAAYAIKHMAMVECKLASVTLMCELILKAQIDK